MISKQLPQRGATLRVLLFSEAGGSLLDLGASDLLAFDPGREAEGRAPVASGGWRPDSRATPFGGLIVRGAEARAWRVMRRTGCPVVGIALGRPSHRGGTHTLHLDPCAPGGESPAGPTPHGAFQAEGFALESRRFHAARWTSGDLLSGVPWEGEEAETLEDAAKGLPYVDRAGLDGSALQAAYEAAGGLLSGPAGYAGPVWAVAEGDGVGPAGALTTDSAVLVLPLPAPGASLRLLAPGAGAGGDLSAALSFYDRDGALLAGGASSTAAATSTAAAAATLPAGTWYVLCEVSGPLALAPSLEVLSAGGADGGPLALGVVRAAGPACTSAPVIVPSYPDDPAPPVSGCPECPECPECPDCPPGECVYPDTPENLVGTPGDDEIAWTWDAVDGADGYFFRWGIVSGGPYPNLVETTDPTFTTPAETGIAQYATVSAFTDEAAT